MLQTLFSLFLIHLRNNKRQTTQFYLQKHIFQVFIIMPHLDPILMNQLNDNNSFMLEELSRQFIYLGSHSFDPPSLGQPTVKCEEHGQEFTTKRNGAEVILFINSHIMRLGNGHFRCIFSKLFQVLTI